MKVLKSSIAVNLALVLLFASPLFGADKIDKILKNSRLGEVQVSIKVVRLPDGALLYSRDPDRLLNPASNIKLLTATAALATLGPNYTFKTNFYADRPIWNGQVNHLWIKGHGDPIFVTEELDSVISGLKGAGLNKITGGVSVDDSYFDHDDLMTFLSDFNGRVYSVYTGALSFNFNSPRRMLRTTEEPALFAGQAILDAFQKNGIVVEGHLTHEATPKNAALICVHDSPPLSEIVRGMDKFSNNFIAEQLVKAMGAERFGPPGTRRNGLRVIQDYLETVRIPRNDYRLENGSGLAKGNLFSASQFVTLLTSIDATPWRDSFLSSLSVAGIDGTLKRKWRRSPLKGRVFAKTGSLGGVQTLSGYLVKGGKRAAFSMLFNDIGVSPSRVTRAEQKILKAVEERL